jgi:MoaA/NifB/PqqE/SkfB family radical SAM enzyme
MTLFRHLYSHKTKRFLSALLGQGLYLKIASLPHCRAMILPQRWMSRLGLIHHRSLPDAIAIETNAYCNRKCPYCPNSRYDLRSDRKTKIDKGLFRRIIDELAEMNYYRTIYFNIYNEPLTDERLPDLVEYTRYKLPGITIEIYTNGDYLDYGLYRLLREKGVNRFIISIHGESLSVKLAETLRNIQPEERGVSVIVRNTFDDYMNGRDVFFNRGGSIDIKRTPASSRHCPYVLVCNIDFKGNVILCCNDYFSRHVFGNVNTQALRDIWFDRDYMLLRNRIALGYRDLPICRQCNI